MAYRYEKETDNPFISSVEDKWNELIEFEGDSIIEKGIKSISIIIVLCILLLLIPIGVIISIYNSLYNLQKKVYDYIDDDYSDSLSSKFVASVEYGIYVLLSLPFFLSLIPYWVISFIITWSVRHKVVAMIIIVVLCVFLSFGDVIINWLNNLIK